MVKLNGRDATQFCAKPDLKFAGVLIYGEDGAEIATRRAALVKTLLSDGDDADMRLSRVDPGELRREPSLLTDAMKARAFFGGQQVVVIEGGTDTLAKTIEAAIQDALPDDAFLVVTAGSLSAKSKLRKTFEASPKGASAPCYADVPDQRAIAEFYAAAGGGAITDEALRDLAALAQSVPMGTIRDVLTRLALYAADMDGPVQPVDVAQCAPGSGDVDLDETIDAVAAGRADAIGPMLSRLMAQGQAPTGLAIAGQRYFRRMHAVLAMADRGGSLDGAIGALRPPVFGQRRDALITRCRIWNLAGAEAALSLLLRTDNDLRGGIDAPSWALLERALLKLALTAQRGQR